MTASFRLHALYGLLAVLRILQNIDIVQSQPNLAVPLQTTCPTNKFFDINTLQCTDCPQGAFPNSQQRACVSCDATNGRAYDFEEGFSMLQTWSPAILQSASTCACQAPPTGSTTVIAALESNGTFVQRCVVCPSDTQANAQGQCAPTNPALSIPPSAAAQLNTAIRLLTPALTPAGATQATLQVPSTTSSGTLPLTIQQSKPLVELLGPAAMTCLNGLGADRAACNAVANLCVLTLYDSGSGPCQMYNQLVNRFTTGASTPSPPPPPPQTSANRGQNWKPATGNMPWLFYQGSGYLNDPNMNLRVQFSGGSLSEGQVSMLTFVLSAYLLNGTWLGYNTWTSEFQLCGAPVNDGSRWYRFGWNYWNSCTIKLEMLLPTVAAAFTGAGDTVLYELFLQTGPSTMYPIPILISNMFQDPITQGQDQGAVRRFFYVDAKLGYSLQTNQQQVVQYPSDMSMQIVLRNSPRDQIYVPQLVITYSAWETNTLSNLNLPSDEANTRMPTTFSVTYLNDETLTDRFWYAWRTVLIVFECVLAFPALMLSVFRFMRKQREQADVGFIVYAGICFADYGSFVLALVLLVVSLYYLVLYKLQEEVYFLMLQDWQLKNFRTTVILAIVGQTLGLLYNIWRQLRTDVFFIDWEKSRKVLSKEGSREEPGPVSCWRMLMVANEFNELQTVRVTYPPFTFLLLVLILDGANVIASGNMTPDANDYHDYFGTVPSIILRMGVESFFFLVLFMGQFLFKKLIYYPYISNPVTQFVDLMFLANISTVIFDDTHSGYYIHGRNQAQHSDTTLRELNEELLKEEEGLVSNRGLVNSSSNKKIADNQLFLMYITDSIRKTYDAKMLALVQQASNDSRMRKGTVSTFLRGTGRQRENLLNAYQEISLLFKQMLEDVERNQAQQVIDPTYIQRFLQLPPENSINNPCFVHDYFDSFTNTMFLGNEIRLYVYEALFFCAIDMNLKNVTVSALLTFVVIRFFSYVRGVFGESNLSQKTLVDRHFLI